MEWLWVAVSAVVVAVLAREFHGLRAAGVGRVVPGRHRKLAAELPRPDRAVAQDLLRVAAPATVDSSARAATATATASDLQRGPGDRAGVVAGTLAATAGLVDWWTVDPQLLVK
ncbi:hypothetical protein [Geodermatophilus sp. SYSU D00710]